jgi:hypothetical protein
LLTWWEEIPAFVHGEAKFLRMADSNYFTRRMADEILAEAIERWLASHDCAA